MAKDAWLTVNPMYGVGNAELSNSGTVHTGRLQRSTVVTAVVSGISAGKSYSVNQMPSSESLAFDTLSFDVGEEAGTLTLSGKSNSPKITFSLATGNDIPFVLPDTYTAAGLSTANGANIGGDPGAAAAYNFSIVVPIPKNTVGERIGKIIATGSTSSVQSIVAITQATSTYNVAYIKGDYIDTIDKTSQKVDWGKTATATAALLSDTIQYTYTFDGWYEGSNKIGSDLALSVPDITSDRTFTAIGKRTLNRYTLAITVTPTGAGTTVGQGTYDYGSLVTATATPETGYDFVKWVDEHGIESADNPLTDIEMNGDRSFEAVFALKRYLINISAQYRVAETGDFTTGTTGGEVSGGGTKTHGTSVSLVAAPETGYSFDGWYEGSTRVSTDLTYTFTAVGNRTLVGKFQRKWFTITFTAGTGGTVAPTSSRVEWGDSAESTATASAGYIFSGWNDGTLTEKLTVTNVQADATYAASFGLNTYVVTYQAGEGVTSVSPTSETVSHGSNAVGSTATLTAGYDFLGWYNGDTQVSTALKYGPTNVTGNMTLVAKGKIKRFRVDGSQAYRDTDSTGDWKNGLDGGYVYGGGFVNYGDDKTLGYKVTEGYTFLGWYDKSGTYLGNDATYTVTNVTSDGIVITARFQKNWYTITYSKGTGVNALSKTSERVAYGGTAISDTAVASTGYNSPTWTKNSGTATLSVTAGKATLTGVQSDCTLTASATIDVYTISYSKNGNISTISKTSERVNYGGTATCVATLPANTAQYSYSFQGWYEGSTQVSTALSLSVKSIASNRSFEARGLATTNRYTLTVTNGSGSGTYDYNTAVTVTANSIAGKTFSKWSDGNTSASRTVYVTSNISLTAQYTDNYYTITYTKGTGINTLSRASESVIYNGNSLGCTATVAEGYTFKGWYNGSALVSSSLTYAPTGVTANLALVAEAQLNSYTITPSAYSRANDGGNYAASTAGGTVSGGGAVNHGGSITVTASANTAAGYQFDGWYSAGATGGSLLSSNASYQLSNVTASQTVYARFSKKWFTVTYVAGDYVGSLSRTSERVAYGANALGSTITPAATTAQYSYSVRGWYSGSTLVTSAASYGPTNVTGNLTYTAHCNRSTRSYTVTLNSNGGSIPSTSGWSGSGTSATKVVVNGSPIGTLPNPTRSASDEYTYAFSSWNTAANGSGTNYSAGSAMPASDLTLYAVWTATKRAYTISSSLESSSAGRGQVCTTNTPWSSAASEQFQYGTYASVGVQLNSSDYVFDGWYENGARVSTNIVYGFTCTGPRSLVAKIYWMDVSPTSLAYDADGGTKTVTVSTNVPNWTVS